MSNVTARRCGPWLIVLYILAMLGGVVPLMRCHSAHAAAVSIGCSADRGGLAHQQHHTGDIDDVAHDHALQDISGIVAAPIERSEKPVGHRALTLPAPRVMAATDPILPERPPKHLLSI